jgi:hypothetical protein
MTGMNIEGTNVASSVGLQFIGNDCVVDAIIFKWDIGVKIGDGTASNARGFNFTGDLTGNDTFDIQLTSGGNRKFAYVKNLGVAQIQPIPVVDNQREPGEAFGELFVWSQGNMPIGRVTPISYIIPSLTNADATPSVIGSEKWLTGTAITITDLVDGVAGQVVDIISTSATTYDTTGTNLTGSSVDIVTANGDLTTWLCKDGTTWTLKGFIDVSADNSGGA